MPKRVRTKTIRRNKHDSDNYQRWRPWRRQSTPSENSSAESSDEENQCKSKRATSFIVENMVTAKADIIPLFNPENDIFISQWINKIEQMASIHNWTDKIKSHFMQSRLTGMAKVWHSSLQQYDMTWEEWKAQLLEAFPRNIDFVESLRDMLAKRKTSIESMTQYFYNKNAMLTRLEIFGEKAVACLIDGLPMHMRPSARAGNYSSPSELYSKFLSVMEESRPKIIPASRQINYKPASEQYESREIRKPIVCFLCQETGHTIRRCPKHSYNSRPSCSHCGKYGHLTDKCWYKPGTSSAATASTTMQETKKQESVNFLTEVNDIYFKTILVNNISARAYFDSGAKINVINHEFALKINVPVYDCNLLITGFGGTSVRAEGYIYVTLTIGDNSFDTKCIITNWHMTAMDLIVGQPIINDPNIKFIIDGTTIEIKRNNPISEILDADMFEQERQIPLTCTKHAMIPPGHVMLVNVTCDAPKDEFVYIDSCRRLFYTTDYTIPSCLISGGCNSAVEIFNTSTYPLRLFEGQLLVRGSICGEFKSNSIKGKDQNKIDIFSIDISRIRCGVCDETIKQRLYKLLAEYSDCFSANTNELGCTNKISMFIEVNSDKPVCYRPYRLSMPEKAIVREKVDDLLKNNIIRDSSSAYASPIILVKKKGGGYRLCVDYRKLNSMTVKDKYPLPVIEEQVEKLSGKRFFSSLDLSQGFYQIPLHTDSIPKTGFVTPEGHYEFTRMPFGLTNSPCVFQRLMDKILGALRFETVLPYIDDLLIPSVTEEEGLNTLKTVLEIIRSAKLTLNIEKCAFLESEIEYLGYEISEKGIRPGQKKIDAVSKYKEPCNIHELRMFLGLTSYFRKFVKNYAIVTHDLYRLLKKNCLWEWGPQQQSTFDLLKQLLTDRPILALYNPKAETEVHTDASSKGVAGILLQKTNGLLKPVAYYSRKTTKEEALYHSFELETLAVVESLKRFRIYLAGIQFKVITDCVAVRQTFEKKDLLPRVARWWLSIQDYNMDIEHKPGLSHKHVDALSRTPVGMIEVLVLDILDWVVCLQNRDSSIGVIKHKLENNIKDPEITNNYVLQDYKLHRKIVNDQLRLVIPKAARWNIMRKYHDDIGHPGLKKCEEIIKGNCWFPRMTRFIKKYVNACIDCLYKRGQYGKPEGNLHPIHKIAEPMDTLHIDHLGPFCKSSKGFSYLFVIVDSYTKFVWAKPTKTTKSLEAEEKLCETFSYFGYPRRLISDSGTAFTSKRFKHFCSTNQIKHIINTIATPRSNGQVERFNRTILESINKSTTDERDWVKCLDKVIWGINNTVNSSTGFTAYRLMFHAKRSKFQDMSTNQYDDESTAAQVKERAARNIEKVSAYMKKRFDEKRRKPTEYKIGDLVLWKGAQGKNKDAVRKLKEKYSGPYKIKRVLGNDRYLIVSIKGLKGYKKYQARVASDALRRFTDDNKSDSDSSESQVDSTEELIDLLEG